jgi:hypothetical protein
MEQRISIEQFIAQINKSLTPEDMSLRVVDIREQNHKYSIRLGENDYSYCKEIEVDAYIEAK